MRPNWFIAFPVPGGFMAELPPPPPQVRLVPPADLHLTLAFLGPCGEAAAGRAWHQLELGLTARPRPAFSIALGDVVPMGRPRRYSALSARLTRGHEQAAGWLADWEVPLLDTARPGRPRRAPRPSKPHITLARPARRADDVQRQQGLAWAQGLDLAGVCATLDRLALYTWSDDRPQRLFRAVRTLPLPRAAAG